MRTFSNKDSIYIGKEAGKRVINLQKQNFSVLEILHPQA